MFFRESSGKKNLVIALSIGHGKMVFTLLDKFVTVYVGLTLVYVRDSSFEQPFSKFVEMVFGRGLRLEDHLEDLLQIILRILEYQGDSENKLLI